MDGDLGSMLQSVLSDPEQMAKLGQVAQSLMGEGRGAAPPPAEAAAPPSPAAPSPENRILSLLTEAMTNKGGSSRSAALLTAMRPYMRPEKQAKLDRAMEMARMARIAGMVMGELGGGDHGL